MGGGPSRGRLQTIARGWGGGRNPVARILKGRRKTPSMKVVVNNHKRGGGDGETTIYRTL